MDVLPQEVFQHELLPRALEYTPALRAVCHAWRNVATTLPVRATKGHGLTFLAERGHTALILWTREGRQWEFQPAQLHNMLCAAAASGRHPLAKLLCEWGATEAAGANGLWQAILKTARHAHYELLFFLRDQYLKRYQYVVLYATMIEQAARGGRRELVEGIWQWSKSKKDRETAACAYRGAARGGHLALMDSMASYMEPLVGFLGDVITLERAARGGHIQVMRVVNCKIDYSEEELDQVMEQAVRGGHLDAIKLLWSWGATDAPYLNNKLMRTAARYGHHVVVTALRGKGASDYDLMLEGAARGGHIALCRQARAWGAKLARGGKLVTIALLEAATFGSVPILKLFREWVLEDLAGGVLSQSDICETFAAAFSYGKTEAAVELRSWGAKMPEYPDQAQGLSVLADAVRSGNLELLRLLIQWSLEDGAGFGPHDYRNAMREALEAGEVGAMRLLHGQTGTPAPEQALAHAAAAGRLEAMDLVKSWRATEYELNHALTWAAENNRLAAMRLLRSWGASGLNKALLRAKDGSEARALLLEWMR